MEVKGKVLIVGETQEIGSNGFRKKELVLELEGNTDYPQSVKFELHGDKCDLEIQKDKFISANINIRGRKWTNPQGVDVYFNTLVIWSFKELNEENAVSEQSTPAGMEADADDDLPF